MKSLAAFCSRAWRALLVLVLMGISPDGQILAPYVTASGATSDTLGSAPQPDGIALMLDQMSTEDKIGQLLLLGFSGTRASDAASALQDLRAGGIAFLANTSSADHARMLSRD